MRVPAGATAHRPGPAATAAPAAPPASARIQVLDTYPHDPSAFTQGLQWCDGLLYEGTGGFASSELRVVDLGSGEVRRRTALPAEYFGEGIATVGDQLWQLTWREGVAFRRDRESLDERARVRYDGEGWGLCHDAGAGRLIMSDGSSRLTFRDPATFEVVGTVQVRREHAATDSPFPMMLNDLTCSGGLVWANVYPTDEIVGIHPDTGEIAVTADASALHAEQDLIAADVLNGITCVPGTDRFLITGKLWARLYEVRFVALDHAGSVDPAPKDW